MLGRLSLRSRLLAGLVLLAAIGLLAADGATYLSLRTFLLNRVDDALNSRHAQVERTAFGVTQPGARSDGGARPDGGRAPDGGGPPAQGIDWYAVTTTSGQVTRSGFLVGGGSPPQLPARITLPAAARAGVGDGDRQAYFTVASRNGATQYRVRAAVERQRPGVILVVASSLRELHGTLNRLLVIELIGTGAVLLAITGLGLWVVRLGLRPLRQIERTSSAIAAGDLTRRVEREDDRTEVGRLGRALNTMLAQIEKAFRARESSEQRLRRFVADASHELRTPLTAVRAYAELFDRGAAARPEDLSRAMSGITRETERMSVLVEDLLLLARLDEGRPLAREQLALDRIVNEAVDAAQVVEPARPVQAEVKPAVVIGDRDRLRQSIDNLLSNVRAHTPPQSPVRVTLRRVEGRAVVEVTDSGPGLTDEQAERVFERFYRTDESRTRASGGLGLGLSIVAAVAAAHGGRASVASAVGEGATFRIDLPALPEESSPTAQQPDRAAVSAPVTAR